MKQRIATLSKRILILLLCFTITACVVAASYELARNMDDYSGSCGEKVNWRYDAEKKTLTILGEGNMSDFNNTYVPWKSVRAFIKNVVVEKGVTSLGKYSFSYCVSLTNVKIPTTVTSIGSFCFTRCFDLESIEIPSSVTSIADRAFYYCTSLKSITVPSSVTSIGVNAFQRCSSLTSFAIPPNVRTVEYGTFAYCTHLSSVTIPSNVTSIGMFAFHHCESLSSIAIPESVTSIEQATFQGCSSIINVTLPSGLTTIGVSAFRYCTSLINITIPSSVKEIKKRSFEGCSSLSHVSISNGTVILDNGAFYGCNLTTITIPSTVTSIGTRVFGNCDNLVSIDICNDNFLSIDGVLFERKGMKLVQYPCGKEGDYVIPENVTIIKDNSFEGSHKLTSVFIPPSVEKIGSCPFYGCSNLLSINVSDNQHFTSNDGVLFGKNGQKLIQFPCGKNESYTIPGDVDSIETYAFGGCRRLKNVTISNGVNSIKECAFSNCTNLTSITIPSSVSSIDRAPFVGCCNLASISVDVHNPKFASIDGVLFNRDYTKLIEYPCGHSSNYTVPDDVTTIGESSFSECFGLTSVTIPATVTSIEHNAFNGVNMAYVNYLGSTEPNCDENDPSATSATTFAFVDVVCVPMDYNSTGFCRIYKVNVDSCEHFVTQQNQCYEVLEWQAEEVTVKKRANATLWEKRTNKCFEYKCSNETGGIARSLCNSTDEIHRMCIDNDCVEEAINQERWGIEMTVDINPKDFDLNDLSAILVNGTGIDGMTIGTEAIQSTGNVVRIVVYVDDENSASAIASFVEDCLQDNH